MTEVCGMIRHLHRLFPVGQTQQCRPGAAHLRCKMYRQGGQPLPRARPAKSAWRAPRSSRVTSTGPTPLRRPSSTAGCSPATSVTSTRIISSTWSTAPGHGAARRRERVLPEVKRHCTSTRTWRSARYSQCPTSGWEEVGAAIFPARAHNPAQGTARILQDPVGRLQGAAPYLDPG